MTARFLTVFKILNWLNIDVKPLLRHTAPSWAYELAVIKNIYQYSVTIPMNSSWEGSLIFDPVPESVHDTLKELSITLYHVYYDWSKFVYLRLQEIEGEIPVIWQKDLEMKLLFRNEADALLFRLTY